MARPEFTTEERSAREHSARALRASLTQTQAARAVKAAEVAGLLHSVETHTNPFEIPTAVMDTTSTRQAKEVFTRAGVECLPDSALAVQPVIGRSYGAPLLGFNIVETDASGQTPDPRSTFQRITVRLFAGPIHTSTEEPQNLVVVDKTGRSSIINVAKFIPEHMGRLDFAASLATTVLAAKS